MANTRRVGRHMTKVENFGNGGFIVTYHKTPVVNVTEKQIVLNTGGHFSATTKLRMNQAANQYGLDYHVYQKDYQWYVVRRVDGEWQWQKAIPFRNTYMILDRTV